MQWSSLASNARKKTSNAKSACVAIATKNLQILSIESVNIQTQKWLNVRSISLRKWIWRFWNKFLSFNIIIIITNSSKSLLISRWENLLTLTKLNLTSFIKWKFRLRSSKFFFFYDWMTKKFRFSKHEICTISKQKWNAMR